MNNEKYVAGKLYYYNENNSLFLLCLSSETPDSVYFINRLGKVVSWKVDEDYIDLIKPFPQ